jgi:hypothetical protein
MSPTILEGTIVLLLVALLVAYTWMLARLWRLRRAEKQAEQQNRLQLGTENTATPNQKLDVVEGANKNVS